MLYEHRNRRDSTGCEMSPAMSTLYKLLLITTALGAMILTLSMKQHEEVEPVQQRTRRDLIYPIMVFPSGTVFQFNVAVQTPIPVPNKTLSISLGLQFNFVLPTNVTEFRQWNGTRPKRDIGEALLPMYLPLEAFLQDRGFDGGACMLRSICEAAHSPFKDEDIGLLEEIAHAILTPSEALAVDFHCNGSYSSTKHQQKEVSYLAAECFGRSGGDCFLRYEDCPESPLDFISKKINNEIIF